MIEEMLLFFPCEYCLGIFLHTLVEILDAMRRAPTKLARAIALDSYIRPEEVELKGVSPLQGHAFLTTYEMYLLDFSCRKGLRLGLCTLAVCVENGGIPLCCVPETHLAVLNSIVALNTVRGIV